MSGILYSLSLMLVMLINNTQNMGACDVQKIHVRVHVRFDTLSYCGGFLNEQTKLSPIDTFNTLSNKSTGKEAANK